MPRAKKTSQPQLVVYDGAEQEATMWKQFGPQIIALAKPHFDNAFIKQYKKKDPDSISFLLFQKSTLLAIAICDRWIGKKFEGVIADDQLFIGLFVSQQGSKGYGKMLVQTIETYARASQMFQFISLASLPNSAGFWTKQGFIFGYSNGICAKSARRTRLENKKDAKLPNIPMHKCIKSSKTAQEPIEKKKSYAAKKSSKASSHKPHTAQLKRDRYVLRSRLA